MTPPHRLRLLAAGVSTAPRAVTGRLALVGVAASADEVASLKEALDPDVVLVEQSMAHLAAELEGCGVVVVDRGPGTHDRPEAGARADERLPHELLEALAVLGWLGAAAGPTLAPASAN